jgi:hypothetical protein
LSTKTKELLAQATTALLLVIPLMVHALIGVKEPKEKQD